MSRVPPVAYDALDGASRALVDGAVALMGFLPNDGLVMAHKPELLAALSELVGAVYGPSLLDAGLKRLIGEATSKAAGCFYCSAHAAHGAESHGVSHEKIEAVWNFEDSPLFTEAERAAISLGMKAGRVPNEATDADFEALRAYFGEAEIIEIVSVISMFGFLNRWNSTLGTALEPKPSETIAGLGR